MKIAGLIAAAVVAVGCSSGTESPQRAGAPPAADAGASAVPDGGTGSTPADGGTGAGGGGSAGGTDAGTGSGGGSADAGDTGGSSGGSGGGSGDAGGSGGAVDGGSAGGGDSGADAGTVATGPQILTTGEKATALAIEGDFVYWLSSDTYTYRGGLAAGIAVRSMPKSGGPVAQIAQALAAPATNIVAPGNGIVWAASDCGAGCDPDPSAVPWGVFTADASAPNGTRRVAATFDPSMVGADQSTVFVRTVNTIGVWSLMACSRAPGGTCTNFVRDDNPLESIYVDGGAVYWVHLGTPSPDAQGITLRWNEAAYPHGVLGSMIINGPGYTQGLRVDGTAFALREGGRVWTGTLRGSAHMIWQAPNGSDVDINQGRVFWNQSADPQYPGCLGSANLDGTDGKCLDQGDHSYGGVRVEDDTVWFIRDGQIARLPRR